MKKIYIIPAQKVIEMGTDACILNSISRVDVEEAQEVQYINAEVKGQRNNIGWGDEW